MQTSRNFPPLELEARSHVDTACTAFHLMRKPQTMRAYACLESGPIRPIRINGRLAWSVDDIKRLLNVPLAAKCKANVDETGLHSGYTNNNQRKK